MINPGYNNKYNSYDLYRYRVARALTWVMHEGSELGEVVRRLSNAWSLSGIGSDEQIEAIIHIMEDFAFGYALELKNDWNGIVEEWEPKAVLEALRYLRETHKLHPSVPGY